MRIIPSKKDKEIEKAIIMLVNCVSENCRNPKPLILHSVRVGMKLLELNQPKEVVIAGFLHDLVEDTNCKITQIKKEFSPKVTDLVLALTQEKIKEYKERWHVLLSKIKKTGKGAMIIKVLDNNDNLIHYFPSFKKKEVIEKTLWKYHFTIKSLKPYLANLRVFKEYAKNYELMEKRIRVSVKNPG